MNNIKFSNEEKQFFYGAFPIVAQSLQLKTTVVKGDVVGVDANGNYGKYDETTYTTAYAVAIQTINVSSNPIECECILTAYLMENAVQLPEDATKKLKLKQELRKIGIFLR